MTGPHPTEIVDIRTAPGFPWIQLHRARRITESYPRHWHDELYLSAVFRGANHLEYAGTSACTPPRTLTVIPPGDIHANYKEACAFRCMFIDSSALQSTLEDFTERTLSSIRFRGGVFPDPQTLQSFVGLHRLLGTHRSALRADSAVSHFLHTLVAHHSDTVVPLPPLRGQENAAVLRAQRFLQDHYAEPVTLRQLARLTGVSPFHLNRSFCKKVGMPPHAYQVQVRISRAKAFLRSGSTIAETALSAGFVDQSHFSHLFKKFVGMTPGQFLR